MVRAILAASCIVSASAAQCDIEEAWSGQRQIIVPGCSGTGCNANGKDWDCAWCVYDIDTCMKVYGDTCTETSTSRSDQNASCDGTPMQNIVELAESVDDLSTLVAAVVAGDLVDTLTSPGPFTVFAPVNSAFAALPEGTLDSLMKPENKAQLVDILTYHVVGAAAYSKDLSDGQTITTVEGKDVTVHVGDGVTINNANVAKPDVMASNGVVHVIDAVLIPPEADEPTLNIVELAQSVDDLSTLVAAVVAGDLVGTLSSPGPFTVFAPVNSAFAALPAGTLDTLLKPESKDQLVDILTYHVVGAVAFSKDLSDGQSITTVEGKDITVHIDAGVKINDANVAQADVVASNGVVHVIDAVLIPPEASGSEPKMNIVELAQSVDALSTLVAAVVAGDLVDTLSSPGPFTVFAPVNSAFAALPSGTLDTLLKPENKGQLVDILTYHVVGAVAFSKDLSDGQSITTVEGKDVTVHIGDGVKINDANVVTPDVEASNGVVHVVDAVLLPPTDVEV